MTTEFSIDALRSAVRALHGARLTDVGRTVDMVELGLARGVESVRLHVSCPSRITQGDQIVLGTADMRYPLDRQVDRATAFQARTTQFDRIATILTERLSATECVVTSAEIGAGGALRIGFVDLRIEIFPDVSGPIECWRLFVKGSDDHFVYRARPRKDP